MFGFGLNCASATSSHSTLSPGKSDAFSQPPCSRQTTLNPASARCRAATEPPAPAPITTTSAFSPLPEIEKESGAAGSTGSGGGACVVLIGPRAKTGSRRPSRRSYSASSEKGALLPWPGVADPLADLEVHVVAARGDLRERRETVGVLGVQAARLGLRVAPLRSVQHGCQRREEVGPRRERAVEPLVCRPGLARRRHRVRGGDEDVGERPERRALLLGQSLLARDGHGSS